MKSLWKLNQVAAFLCLASLPANAQSGADVHRKPSSAAEETVEFSSRADLLKLVQAINSVNDGSDAGGKVTDVALIQCVNSMPDNYCRIAKAPDSQSRSEFVDLSRKSDLLKLVQGINSVNNGSDAGGKVTDLAQIQCTISTAENFCTISKLLKSDL